MAFSTNPKDAPAGMGGSISSSVYPVMPSGTRVTTSGGSTQTIVIGGRPAGTLNQPISIGTATTTTAPAAPAPATPVPPGRP